MVVRESGLSRWERVNTGSASLFGLLGSALHPIQHINGGSEWDYNERRRGPVRRCNSVSLTVYESGLKVFKGVNGGTWLIRRTGPVKAYTGYSRKSINKKG